MTVEELKNIVPYLKYSGIQARLSALEYYYPRIAQTATHQDIGEVTGFSTGKHNKVFQSERDKEESRECRMISKMNVKTAP